MNTNRTINAKTATAPFAKEADFQAFIAENEDQLANSAVRLPERKNQVLVKAGSPADTELLSASADGTSTALMDVESGDEKYRIFLVSDPLLEKAKMAKQ